MCCLYLQHPKGIRLRLTAVALTILSSSATGQSRGASCTATATPFLPGVVSLDSTHDDYVTLSPSGDTVVFTRLTPNYGRGTLYWTTRQGESWRKAEPLPFSGAADVNDSRPFFSPDGRRLYFASGRMSAGAKGQLDIWYVDLRPTGWGEPQNAGPEVNTSESESHPSVTRDGTLYFTRFGMRSPNDIWRASRNGVGFDNAVRLDSTINTRRADSHPSIDSEERFLLFARDGGRDGGDDVFVAWRTPTGWRDVQRLPEPVRSDIYEYSAKVSPDRTRLLFSRTDFSTGGRRADIVSVPACALPAPFHHLFGQ